MPKEQSVITNVLAERYASGAMKAIWSPEGRILIERDYWIAVMKAQRELGLKIPDKAIKAYEKVKTQIDLKSIDARERQLLHDVKARIEEFNGLAGYEFIHLGMTSRDLTENVEQLQVLRALELIRVKTVASLSKLSERAVEYKNLMITGRTHNVPAQATTLGKRLAMAGQELLIGLERLDDLTNRYPARGLKGAVGTQLDQQTLFEGDAKKVADLEAKIVKHLGFGRVMDNVGQVYPRSVDLDTVTALEQLASAAVNMTTTVRLMAGQGLMTEGFKKGQVGSSAMPHKVNCRTSERIHGFGTILKGYAAMAAGLTGGQWNEGDVSCSVVRRVMLPDAFFAIDGLMEAYLTVLGQMGAFEKAIAAENAVQLPFLATTTILMESVKAGAGRETAHLAIKENALAASKEIREGRPDQAKLTERLADDERIPLDLKQLEKLLSETARFVGAAPKQVDQFKRSVAKWSKKFPEATKVKPGSLL
ncbi:adenylosuccinate lyase [Pelagicoccus sp. SDUM812003]|uniref:adenylosuccinate lyase n=1 Tax=Pelagicoccus sp. SDUM812003 TaxID=3041267 RepID=UPI00280E31A4|nr:adenylosuccinate lyase [Pelagicoccus sp. SDUM812003]MDQ8202324.1 adenylosuccinate lyase [Pelagicoccus sp. SDUM812003]